MTGNAKVAPRNFIERDTRFVERAIAVGSKNFDRPICVLHRLAERRRMVSYTPSVMEGSNMIAPAFAAPPHLVDESGALRAWFIEPAGALLQFARPDRGTTQ